MITQKQRTTDPPAPLSPAKKRILSAITIAFPFVVVVLFEMGLRAFGYGPDLSLFKTVTTAGKTFGVLNPDVKGRYFSRLAFDPSTSPDRFVIPKPAGMFRIFCLGGSTTAGYPYWFNGSFPSLLRDRLHSLFPDRAIEVINLGMTATNSHTVLDFAQELIDYQPDLLLVYDGHNEFYGGLGVASRESIGSQRFFTRIYLSLLRFRTFILLKDALAGFLGLFTTLPTTPTGGTLMEQLARDHYVPYGSDLYSRGLTIFKENLQDLRRLCRTHGIPVVVSSQVSNLRDQPPFVSGEASEARERARILSDRGRAEYAAGRFDASLAAFDSVTALDSLSADAHYRAARSLDTLGRHAPARQRYFLARDLDHLRFRASSDFNTAIRDLDDEEIVHFLDMERVFTEASRDSLIGRDLITEHLHPNSNGAFRMAAAFANAMKAHGLLADRQEWITRDTIRVDSLESRRNLTELDEMMARRKIQVLTSGWPFQSTPRKLAAPDTSDSLAFIVDRFVMGVLPWQQAHLDAADFYARHNEPERAAKEYSTIISQYPYDITPYLLLAQLHIASGHKALARKTLLQSLELERTTYAFHALGTLAYNDTMLTDAERYLREAMLLSRTVQERSRNGYLLALTYARRGDADLARQQLADLLRQNPQYQPARELLQKIGRK